MYLSNQPSWRTRHAERRAPIFGRLFRYLGRQSSGRGRGWTPQKIIRLALTLGVLGFFAFAIMVVGVIAWVSRDLPNPNGIIEREVPLSTKIYDRTGEQLLYEVHGNEKRTIIELSDIPPYAIAATLTAEDRNFYEHRGFSLTGMLRSVIKNFTTGTRTGGSTITQQLVKNAILTNEKTYTRKLKELILAYQIERKFSKDEILKLYFNEIPYGSVVYGIEAAAQTFFGKSARDLTVAEAAILAALPQLPTYYSPHGNNRDKLIIRQQWILHDMADLGYITAAEAEAAKAEELNFEQPIEYIQAPHFVTFVREYLSEKYGEKTVGEGGLRVITTLDMDKQKMAEEAIQGQVEKNSALGATNAALVSLDAKTGEILAMVGSVDFFNEEIDGQVNVTVRPRQPGSSFKPIVYAAALKKGFTPDTVVFDVVTPFTNYDGKVYEPKNYNLKEHGPVTFRQALAGSLNIPAVKAIYLTGIKEVLDLADALGYTTLQERWRFGLSLVLGGGEVTLLDHVSAFAVFARDGEYHPPVGILRVEDKDKNVLEEFKQEEKKILETEVARNINAMLSDNAARAFIFGERNFLTLPDRPVAAKTGTTNDYHDAWTIGYTPSIATGVWVGNNDNTEMKRGADGSVVAAPIWNKYMAQALANTPVESFNQPKPIISDNPALNGSLREGVKVKVDRISGKLASEYTPPEFIEERTYRQLHDILYYVDKDDPAGPPPADPAQDPQFAVWEAAVAAWGAKNNVVAESPPTEIDDVHGPNLRPIVDITAPAQGQMIQDRNVQFDVSVTAPRSLSRVAYFINGRLIGEKYHYPYNLSVYLDHSDIPGGAVTLRAVAYDDAGNSGSDFIDINLALEPITPGITWLAPRDSAIITADSFPLPLKLLAARKENIERITLYRLTPNRPEDFVNEVRLITQDDITSSWSGYPGPGIYQLYAQIQNRDGFIYQSEKITVEVK